MHVYSYKYFLLINQRLPSFEFKQKIILSFFAGLVISAAVVSTFFYFQYAKEAPIRAQKSYIENTIVRFNSTKSITDDFIKNFQIAGAKTEFFADQGEDFDKNAYFVATDDLERLLAQTNQARENLEVAEKARNIKNPPEDFKPLDEQIKNQNRQLFEYMDKLAKKFKFAKEIAMALGPDLYFPSLTSESIWDKKDKEEITGYYEKKLEEADAALYRLSRIMPPEEFSNYYRNQYLYLESLVNLAKDITNTLAAEDSLNEDESTQLEKAYEQKVAADTKNAQLLQKILEGRKNLFNLGKNLNELAGIKMSQNSIGSKLEFLAGTYSQVKIITLPSFLAPYL